MTPEEKAYAAAWLSEMWAHTPEWHEPDVDKAVYKERNALLNRHVEYVAEAS